MSMEPERFEISYPAYLKIPKTNLRIRKVYNEHRNTDTKLHVHAPCCKSAAFNRKYTYRADSAKTVDLQSGTVRDSPIQSGTSSFVAKDTRDLFLGSWTTTL